MVQLLESKSITTRLSLLLFADGSLILFRATEGDSRQLQDILHLYEICSGQMINKAKSTILFSRNTRAQQRKLVCDLLQVTRETMNEKYLGLPVYVGRSKTGVFGYLKDRI